MPDYKTMYFQLAAKVADAIDLLIEVQQQCEDAYIESADEPESAEPQNTDMCCSGDY